MRNRSLGRAPIEIVLKWNILSGCAFVCDHSLRNDSMSMIVELSIIIETIIHLFHVADCQQAAIRRRPRPRLNPFFIISPYFGSALDMCWATRKEWRVLTIKLNFVFLQRSFSRALVGFCVCLKIVYTWFAVFLVDLCVCVYAFPSEAFMCKLVLLVVNKVDKQHNSNRTTDTLGPRWWRVDRVVGRSVGWLARIHFETPFIHLLYLLPLALVWLSIEKKKFIQWMNEFINGHIRPNLCQD